MAKTPKAPKFQNLPTLEGLAIRRRQTIASILSDWGVVDANSLNERLKREGLAPVEDAAALFPSKVVTSKPALVELPKKEPEQVQKKSVEPDSKKPTKAKLSSDAPDPGPEDRATSKPVVVVSDEADHPSSKA